MHWPTVPAILSLLAASALNDLQAAEESKRMLQYSIITGWMTYSCVMSYLAFYADLQFLRRSMVQLASLVIWCAFLWKLHSTMGDNMQEQFLVLPLALVVGLLFLPYLIWMNAEAIVSFKDAAVSQHLIEVKPTFDGVDRFLRAGEYDKALEKMEAHKKLQPESEEMWLKTAEIHLAAENWNDALTAFEKALPFAASSPESQAGIYMRMIDLYWDHLNDNAKAKEMLQTLKTLNLTERSTRFAEMRLTAIG